jgi:hypothetical protein
VILNRLDLELIKESVTPKDSPGRTKPFDELLDELMDELLKALEMHSASVRTAIARITMALPPEVALKYYKFV